MSLIRSDASSNGASSYRPQPVKLGGKHAYSAPEIVAAYRSNPKGAVDGRCDDVWALGMCLWRMLFAHGDDGADPWEPLIFDKRIIIEERLVDVMVEEGYDENFKDPMLCSAVDLLQWIWTCYPDRRPTVDDILVHPFCRGVGMHIDTIRTGKPFEPFV